LAKPPEQLFLAYFHQLRLLEENKYQLPTTLEQDPISGHSPKTNAKKPKNLHTPRIDCMNRSEKPRYYL